MGLTAEEDGDEVEYGDVERGMKEATTRETTYSTIYQDYLAPVDADMAYRRWTYLLVNSTSVPKYNPSPKETCNECVGVSLLVTVDLPLDQHDCLVDGHKLGEVECMLLRCAIDDA